jgi:hypothetical protein
VLLHEGLDRLLHDAIELTLAVAAGRLRIRLKGQERSRDETKGSERKRRLSREMHR